MVPGKSRIVSAGCIHISVIWLRMSMAILLALHNACTYYTLQAFNGAADA
jgi:hypothetical protein